MVKGISSESKNLSYRVYSDESYLETGMEDASSHLCGRFFAFRFVICKERMFVTNQDLVTSKY